MTTSLWDWYLNCEKCFPSIVGGIDWNKSGSTEFKTSVYNEQVQNAIPSTSNAADDKEDSIASSDTPGHQPVQNDVVKKNPTSDTSGLKLNMELICIIVVCSVVLLLILIGSVYKIVCTKKSTEDDDDDDDEDEDDEDDETEKQKLEV